MKENGEHLLIQYRKLDHPLPHQLSRPGLKAAGGVYGSGADGSSSSIKTRLLTGSEPTCGAGPEERQNQVQVPMRESDLVGGIRLLSGFIVLCGAVPGEETLPSSGSSAGI